MPTATLTFNLPEDQEEYNTVMKASNYSHALWEYDQSFLRANLKYGLQENIVNAVIASLKTDYDDGTKCDLPKEMVERVIDATLEYARTKLYEVMNDSDGNPFA